MSEKHVRATDGSKVVVVATDLYHKHRKNAGRECAVCGASWTVERYNNGDFHFWRDGESADRAILDWVGNNVVIECCERRLEA